MHLIHVGDIYFHNRGLLVSLPSQFRQYHTHEIIHEIHPCYKRIEVDIIKRLRQFISPHNNFK